MVQDQIDNLSSQQHLFLFGQGAVNRLVGRNQVTKLLVANVSIAVVAATAENVVVARRGAGLGGTARCQGRRQSATRKDCTAGRVLGFTDDTRGDGSGMIPAAAITATRRRPLRIGSPLGDLRRASIKRRLHAIPKGSQNTLHQIHHPLLRRWLSRCWLRLDNGTIVIVARQRYYLKIILIGGVTFSTTRQIGGARIRGDSSKRCTSSVEEIGQLAACRTAFWLFGLDYHAAVECRLVRLMQELEDYLSQVVYGC